MTRLFSFIFIFFSFCAFSFDTVYTKKDSILIKELEHIYTSKLFTNVESDEDLKLKYFNRAYGLSITLNHKLYIAILEESFFHLFNYTNKIRTFEFNLKAIESYKLLKDPAYYPNIVNLYIRILEAEDQVLTVNDSKILFDSVNFYLKKIVVKKDILVSKLSLSRIYTEINKPEIAKAYIKEVDELSKGIRDSVLNLMRLRLHEEVYNLNFEYNKALIYNDSTILQSSFIPDLSFLMFDYLRRGEILSKMKDYSQALNYFNKSYQISIKNDNITFQVINLRELSVIYFDLKDYKLSQKYGNQSYQISLKNKKYMDCIRNSLLLSKIDSIQKDTVMYVAHLKNYIRFRDTLFPVLLNVKVNKSNYFEIIRMKNQNNLLENENKEKESLLKSEKITNSFLITISIIVFLFASFILFFYLSYKKQTKLLTLQKIEIMNKNNELKDKNLNLEKMYQEKNDLISVVSHDLKAPLNRAKALSELISDTADNFKPEQKMLFEKLIKELADEKNLITEIFNSELLDLELNSFEMEFVELNYLINNYIESTKVTANLKDIELIFLPYLENIFVNINEAYFKRIIDNLVSNAIKFSERGKKIHVLIDSFDDNVFIHVKDEGQGFTETDQADLFKKYHKLSSKPTEGESSTGLGLSIVKRLVTIMGGTISLVSKKEKGSTFTLCFKRIKP